MRNIIQKIRQNDHHGKGHDLKLLPTSGQRDHIQQHKQQLIENTEYHNKALHLLPAINRGQQLEQAPQRNHRGQHSRKAVRHAKGLGQCRQKRS